MMKNDYDAMRNSPVDGADKLCQMKKLLQSCLQPMTWRVLVCWQTARQCRHSAIRPIGRTSESTVVQVRLQVGKLEKGTSWR